MFSRVCVEMSRYWGLYTLHIRGWVDVGVDIDDWHVCGGLCLASVLFLQDSNCRDISSEDVAGHKSYPPPRNAGL